MNNTKFAAMTADDAVAMVADRVSQIRFNDLMLSIDRDHVYRSDYAWHIPIIPSRMPRRFTPLYEELAIISLDVMDTEDISFFFRVEDPVGEGATLPPVDISNAALV